MGLMAEPIRDARIRLMRLYWLGPLTVATSVVAVSAVQSIALHKLRPLPPFSEAVLTSTEPAIVAAVMVSAAVLVFALCVRVTVDPMRTYRRIAFGALLISFVPNVAAVLLLGPAADWPSMIALMMMHVTAWAITVSMLTRMTVARSGAPRAGNYVK